MSDGEDTDSAEEPPEDAGEEPPAEELTDPEEFEQRLDEAADLVEAAETEDDLDEADETIDGIEADLDAATLPTPEPEVDEDEDEEDVEPPDPKEPLEDRISDLRADIEEQRGPYVEDITDVLDSATTTITTSEWTHEGEDEVAKAVSLFCSEAGETLGESFEVTAEDPEGIAEELGEVTETIGETPLDPDDDAGTIAALLDQAETLTDDLDDAMVWSDLEVREQLRRQGFYDVLDPNVTKDFPPELSAINVYEAEGEVEPLLEALDSFDSDFMEENVLDALEHLAPEEAFDPVHALAQRRNKQPVRILGRIGDEAACDTLEDFLGGGDVELEKITLRSLGMIGAERSTDPVAQRLAADNREIRSAAARSLGLIGDTRAVEPLGDVLADDEADEVRASAAWALNQIGTERALETAAEYADDRSYLVQAEAEKAQGV
ncbi:HEAT repeat domain-containing protein [Halovenus sp. WSH3]|uniref:HEAT repeat domain-containing protein n=1 Tax=Halovenus carboxidivorans TaxID=2692199 RepID=A0A6B0T936_9EURY|nr:HEAT repeat domain-containing protein [Halovenus carboxidivorans]MXR52756.1 HEAT repeat domain-containing protein [Halovenus carboxidivorans]